MSDVLLQIGGTKLVLSAVLACAAWMVHRRVRLPGVSYPMWLLVLVVLLVPAFMPLPVLPAAGAEVAGLELAPAGASEAAGSPASFQTAMVSWFDAIGKQGLVILWLLGSAALLGWSLLRAARFRRTLMQALEPAPPELQREAARISRRLGLARVPEVNTTHARISPMVWSTGGRVRVLIPNFVLAELSDAEVRSILAHELAHVRRRDHLVRWLELAACTVFWWNPAAWWASRHLRSAEEACCDALVTVAAGSSAKSYASALLRVADTASESPLLPAPALVSPAGGIGQTKSLERRLKMIVDTNKTAAPGWLRTAAWIAVICALPLGLVYCGQPDTPATVDDATEAPGAEANDAAQAGDSDDAAAGAARQYEVAVQRVRAMLDAGEITEEQANQRLEGLRTRLAAARERTEAGGGDAEGAAEGAATGARRYEVVQRQLEVMLEAGEITAEQAEQRLTRLRARMAPAGEQAETSSGDAEGAARYEAAVQQVEAMLKAGEITAEQAEQRLMRLHVRMDGAAGRGRTPDGNR
ncbi:MAG: M48 family metalloprotease [Gemmatimonadetes bacterium]|nr:M48 family metalloprotease [Gemmatimonadota bacterium]